MYQKITSKTKEDTRLNKFLAESGVCSRREADKLINAYKVFINGSAAELGQKVKFGDVVDIRSEKKQAIYALYYKPKDEETGVINDDPILNGLHPVGRLDKQSDGLLIYTNDYRVTDALLNPKNENDKKYVVRVREKMTPRVERILLAGITTQEDNYAPVKDVKISEDGHYLDITLTEGKKHEIRRMMNALNLTVISLTRVAILFLNNKKMRAGESRYLTENETEKLLKILKLS
jgi:23S rRNA pseudouridine2604 synthase